MTSPSAPAATDTRVSALDGLRGVTIVLVVLGHLSSYLWPVEGLRSTPYLRGLVGGGAVTVFFIVSGYIVTTGLLREQARGRLDPLRFLLRRLVRIGAQVLPLCVVVVIVSVTDSTDENSFLTTMRSVTNTLTYTHNFLYQDNPLGARADMGHLWFLSIQQQWYVLLPFVVIVLASHRLVFAGLAAATALAAVVYRLVTLGDATWFDLAIDTFARADALLLGVVLALVAPLMERTARAAPAVATLTALLLGGLLLVSKEGDALAFLGPWSIAFTLVAALLVAALLTAQRRHAVAVLLEGRAITWLGRASLAIYVWHYPLIYWISRHTTSWTWIPRTITFCALLTVIVYVSNRWVEEPVRRWLKGHLRGDLGVRPSPVAASS